MMNDDESQGSRKPRRRNEDGRHIAKRCSLLFSLLGVSLGVVRGGALRRDGRSRY